MAAQRSDDVLDFLGNMPGFETLAPAPSPPTERLATGSGGSMQHQERHQRQQTVVEKPAPTGRQCEARLQQRVHSGSVPPLPMPARSTCAWPREYPVKSIDLDGSGRTIDIHEAARSNAGGVGGELWDGAIVLARWLQLQLAVRGTGCAVLELGAGTGLVGISAAALGGARVLLTDRGEVFEVTQLNAAKNKPAVESGHGIVECAELDWVQAASEVDTLDTLLDEHEARCIAHSLVSLPMPPLWAEQRPSAFGNVSSELVEPGWDFVVGSDILYDARMYKVLARLVNAAIRAGLPAELAKAEVPTVGSRTVCALSYSVSPHTITRFFRLCEGYGLTVKQLSHGELMADLKEFTRSAGGGLEGNDSNGGSGSDVEEEGRTSHLEMLYSEHCDGEAEDVKMVLVSLPAR
eukprot:COSAG02_NODE_5070_length_4671_cov_2.343613_3_plen_407_part_00